MNMNDKSDIQKKEQKAILSHLERNYNKISQSLNLCWSMKEWQKIIKLDNWSELQELNLSYCQLGKCSNISMLSEICFKKLKNLWIYDNQITAQDLKKILQNSWTELELLGLHHNKIGSQYVAGNDIGWQGIKEIVPFNFQKLNQLALNSNPIGNNGMKYLTKINFPQLSKLDLCKCSIGNEGMKHLIKANWLLLVDLNLSGNNVLFDGFLDLSLMKISPLCQVSFIDLNQEIYGISNKDIISAVSLVSCIPFKIIEQNMENKVFGKILKIVRLIKQSN